jgi:hypothetical protein
MTEITAQPLKSQERTTTNSQSKALWTVSHVLLALALVVLVFYFVVYVAYAVNLIRFPFDYDQGEGFELVDVMMFSQGRWPYQDIEQYPFYGSIYPPLYHILLMPFAWLFGAEYWYGRLFSFLTTLVTATAIGYAVYREGGKTPAARLIAVLSGLAFLSSNIVYHIGPLFRQHIPMFMFETLAIVVLARVNEVENTRRRRWLLLLGVGLLLAAGYTKQLAAFTAIAAFAFLFIRQPRRAVVWGLGFGLVTGAIFLLINVSTNGHWWTQTITANVKDFLPDQAIGLFRLWFNLHGFLIVPALLYVLYEVYFARISIYSVWFVVVTLLNAMAAGTWGAGDSYYATSVAAMCILSGIFAVRFLNRDWTFNRNFYTRLLIHPLRGLAPLAASLGLIVVPLVYLGYGRAVLHIPTTGTFFEPIANVLNLQPNADNGFYDSAGRVTGAYADIGHFTTQADIEAGYRILDYVRETDALVLSEEAAFSLRDDRDVITNPVVLYILDQVGAYDSSNLVGMIERQEFGLVILRAQFYPTLVNLALTAHYEPFETIVMNGFEYILKRPN